MSRPLYRLGEMTRDLVPRLLNPKRVAVLAASLLLASAAAVAWSGPVRASDASNIPGIPLSASVVSGKLGGPIYDAVYSVDVPSGHVLLVSLTGTAGTDFDLYLFDSSATNIYTSPPVGLVASSTGPTSIESIAYPTAGGGLFYIDLSGATNVEGTYRLTVKIAADTTAPTIALTLDGGAPATSSPTVVATVIGADDLSGVSDMQLSGDGVTWSAWEPYATTASWTFPGGDGTKTLWVRARDRAGNVSAPAHASIQLITTGPVVVAREPDPANPVTSTLPTIRVRFSEPIRLSSWINSGLLLQDATGALIFGIYGWDPGTNTGSFTVNAPLVPGASYVVSLGHVVDLAGNPLAPVGSWVIQPMVLPVVSLVATPHVAARGSPIGMTGSVSGGGAAPVVIERLIDGGDWTPVATVFPSRDGTFATTVEVDANSRFRATLPASATSADATSPEVRVLVRREITLAGANASVARRVTVGTRVSLTAVVSPADPAIPVTLSIYRYVSGRGNVLQAALTRTTTNGRYTFSWRPGPGAYLLRLTTPPTGSFANGISPSYRWVAH